MTRCTNAARRVLGAVTAAAVLALPALLPARSTVAAPTAAPMAAPPQHGIPPVPDGTPAAFVGAAAVWAANLQSGWCQWLGVDCGSVVDTTSPTEYSYANVSPQIGVICQAGGLVEIHYKRDVYGPDIVGWTSRLSVALGPKFNATVNITDDNVHFCGFGGST